MSEIPFVKALGDEIERAAGSPAAAAASAAASRSARSRFAIAATGVAAASGVFSSGTPEQLATTGIGCYDSADLEHSDVSVLSRRRAATRSRRAAAR